MNVASQVWATTFHSYGKSSPILVSSLATSTLTSCQRFTLMASRVTSWMRTNVGSCWDQQQRSTSLLNSVHRRSLATWGEGASKLHEDLRGVLVSNSNRLQNCCHVLLIPFFFYFGKGCKVVWIVNTAEKVWTKTCVQSSNKYRLPSRKKNFGKESVNKKSTVVSVYLML